MKFTLVPQFTAKDLDKQVADMLQRVNKVMLNELTQIGLEFVKYARLKSKSQGGFDDQTGNLRSSIGFIITYNGNIKHQDFELSPDGSEKSAGLEAGKTYAEEVSVEHQQGWAIILVAGMAYARWVEAKGYDVISGSTLGADRKLAAAFKRLNKLTFI